MQKKKKIHQICQHEVFFSFPKTILFGISFSLSNPECFGMCGLVGLAELYQCLYGTELQIMRGELQAGNVGYSEEPLPTGTSSNGHTKQCDAAKSPQCPLGWRNAKCSKSRAFVQCLVSLSFSKLIFKLISSWKQFHEVLGQSSVLQTTHLFWCSASLSFSKLIFKLISSWRQFHEILEAKLCLPNCTPLFSVPESRARRQFSR